MDKALPDVQAVCHAFELGAPLGFMTVVPGGMRNRVGRLETSHGVFAVKTMTRDDLLAGFAAWAERAFGVERAAHASGICMPRPIPVAATGRCLAEIAIAEEEAALVRVHEWVADAQALEFKVYSPHIAGAVGKLIGRVHGLGLTGEGGLDTALRIRGAPHWDALAERADGANASWAAGLRSTLSVVTELEAFVESARGDDDGAPMLLSHRDALQKNVLRQADHTLMLVDWDSVGPVKPRHEIASLALTWSGGAWGELSGDVAHGLIDGYRRSGGELDALRESDFSEWISGTLSWFEFNARRALGDNLRDESDRNLAAGIVAWHVMTLPKALRSISECVRLLAQRPRARPVPL